MLSWVGLKKSDQEQQKNVQLTVDSVKGCFEEIPLSRVLRVKEGQKLEMKQIQNDLNTTVVTKNYLHDKPLVNIFLGKIWLEI